MYRTLRRHIVFFFYICTLHFTLYIHTQWSLVLLSCRGADLFATTVLYTISKIVEACSRFKSALCTNSPQYLASHIRYHQPVRFLRSSDQQFLVPTPPTLTTVLVYFARPLLSSGTHSPSQSVHMLPSTPSNAS